MVRACIRVRERLLKVCSAWCYYAALFVPISHGCGVWCVWLCFVLSCDCGGVSVSVRGAAVRSWFHVPAVRHVCALVCMRSRRVYVRQRAPAPYARARNRCGGVITPFRVQKNFIGVKMWVVW